MKKRVGEAQSVTHCKNFSANLGRVTTVTRKRLGPEVEFGEALTSGIVKVRNFATIQEVLLEFGVDASDILKVSGLDPKLFSNNDNVISFSELGRLVTACINVTGCPDIGFRSGSRLNAPSIGLSGLVAVNAENVGDALNIVSEYLRESTTGLTVAIDVRRNTAVASVRLIDPNIENADQISAGSLAVLCNIMRQICGSNWRPDDVQQACKRPRDQRLYSEFYKAPIQWDASEYALGFDARELQNPIPTRDDRQYELLLSLLERSARQGEHDLRHEIKTVLRTQLTNGSLSLNRAATAFELGERTFARRMEKAGLNFSRLVEEVKYETACSLLRTDMKLAEIAAVLCYAEPGVFTRSFKKWSGETPKSWRLKNSLLNRESRRLRGET